VSASDDSDPEQGLPSLTSTGTATLNRKICKYLQTQQVEGAFQGQLMDDSGLEGFTIQPSGGFILVMNE